AISGVYPVSNCPPGGLAIGPSERLLVGCSGDAIAAGFNAQSIILDATNGTVLKTITEIRGSDEVYYNPTRQAFYLAARDMTSDGMPTGTKTPSLGIVDANTMTFVQKLATS